MPHAALTPARVPPGTYRHFKGGEYQVLSVGRHTETDEYVVVYRSVDDPSAIWVRPLEMFTDTIELPEGRLRRFEFSDESPTRLPSGFVGTAVRGANHLLHRLNVAARRRAGRAVPSDADEVPGPWAAV